MITLIMALLLTMVGFLPLQASAADCSMLVKKLNKNVTDLQGSLNGSGVDVSKDWPRQTVLMQTLLNSLAITAESKCDDASSKEAIAVAITFLDHSVKDDSNTNVIGIWYAIVISQIVSITNGKKSRFTIGRKIWGFGSLDQLVNPAAIKANQELKGIAYEY